jgi:predicted nucleic acid-binding protein
LPLPGVPRCRDSFDLPSFHLAVAGKAHVLVSGDRDLLARARAPEICPMLSVEAFRRRDLDG